MVAMTFQPLAWKSFAVALPRPLEVPVIKMVSVMMCSFAERTYAVRATAALAEDDKG
jgi:hypothetical protein